ncbi:MAG: nicotinate-nucleotide adenylyltransferase [Calditerrivibrio sp.]|nr:nicotinate-nucleotide adenylyltransferase [Calditerrivibrio sp.]
MKKIALFGGTFNPVHKGHINLATEVQKIFNFDKFLFIPAKLPPHKNYPIASPSDRIRMLQLATEDLDQNIFDISDIEVKRDKKSYTYLTLLDFNKIYKPNELFFVVGTDIFSTIETWQNWQELFKLSNFVVVNRPEHPIESMLLKIPPKLLKYVINIEDFQFGMSEKIILTKIKEIPISSTDIREMIKDNKMLDYLPDKVYNYIIEKKLYQEEEC